MAAEMVSSAVAQEAVNHVLTKFKEQYHEKSNAPELIERMEMAHIRLEAALETSNKWNFTSAPLVRWKSKLKRAMQDCDDTLRRCRQRLQEEEEVQERLRNSSFPKRIAHTARSFVSSIFYRGNHDDDDLTKGSIVRQFEWYADGAREFLRYVEIGGTPCRYMFFDPLVHHLLARKGTKYCFVRGGQHLSFVLQPFSLPEHGMECSLIFLLEDANAPENNFLLSLNLRLSESTDIVGVAVICLQLFMPLLSSTVEIVKTKLTQLPTKDLHWASNGYSASSDPNECLDNIRTMSRRWYRPNQLCCHQQDLHYSPSYDAGSTSSSSESFQCDIYLEPVNQVYLLGHVALPAGSNRQRAVVNNKTIFLRDFGYLKLGGHFWPHASSKELSPAVGGSATEMINGKAAHHGSLYANISFDELGKIMLPKAVDCLCRNVVVNSYKMLWKSKHGGAYLQVEKTLCRVKHPKRRQGKKIQGWASANYEFMSSWIAHASAQFRGSIMDWAQKQKRLPLSFLSLKTNPCVQHDCPIKLWSLQDNRSWARKMKSSCTFHA